MIFIYFSYPQIVFVLLDKQLHPLLFLFLAQVLGLSRHRLVNFRLGESILRYRINIPRLQLKLDHT